MVHKIIEIIEEYSRKPCLWNRRHKLWRRPDLREVELKKVAATVGLTGEYK